tara:strand:- start:4 stop:240 length:237 start_codon:yes stop_codon:yes gene_type:complete
VFTDNNHVTSAITGNRLCQCQGIAAPLLAGIKQLRIFLKEGFLQDGERHAKRARRRSAQAGRRKHAPNLFFSQQTVRV